jgi:hypothetical protein
MFGKEKKKKAEPKYGSSQEEYTHSKGIDTYLKLVSTQSLFDFIAG